MQPEQRPCRQITPPKRDEERHPRLLSADDWFIDKGAGRDTEDGKRRRRALQACWTDCPMRARLLCLHEGLKPANIEFGIFGGHTEDERRQIFDLIQDREQRELAATSTKG